MLTIKEAIEIFKTNIPHKNIENISLWNDKYAFLSRDKSLGENDTNWDSGLELVDINTGEFSITSVFNLDYLNNSKDIDYEEYL